MTLRWGEGASAIKKINIDFLGMKWNIAKLKTFRYERAFMDVLQEIYLKIH